MSISVRWQVDIENPSEEGKDGRNKELTLGYPSSLNRMGLVRNRLWAVIMWKSSIQNVGESRRAYGNNKCKSSRERLSFIRP